MITNKRTWAAVVIVVGIVAMLWMASKKAAPGAIETAQTNAPPAASEPTPTSAPLVAPANDVERRSSDRAPIIDSIRMEPSVVCAGEEALAEVSAHLPGGDDTSLHVVIDGARGARVPVLGSLSWDGVPRKIVANVYGHGEDITSVTIPLAVRDCTPGRRVQVSASRLANSSDDFEITARVLELPERVGRNKDIFADLKDVHHYTWKFGDGHTEQTTTPSIMHSFAERTQDRRVSNFLVEVEAFLTSGTPVRGRTAIEVENRGREVLIDKNKVLILTQFLPRFAEAHADGSVTQSVRLSHVMPDAVTITGARMRVSYSDERGQLAPAKSIDVSTLLGTNVIPAGRGLVVPLKIDAADARIDMLTFTVSGKASDGTDASGSFSILRPPPPPTKENAAPIANPALIAKISAARHILGKPVVTGEEIARLEREGRI